LVIGVIIVGMEALIEEVRVHPVIWDTTLEIYRDQVKKNAAWEEIAANLQRDSKS
jgi:hypothetical protein